MEGLFLGLLAIVSSESIIEIGEEVTLRKLALSQFATKLDDLDLFLTFCSALVPLHCEETVAVL